MSVKINELVIQLKVVEPNNQPKKHTESVPDRIGVDNIEQQKALLRGFVNLLKDRETR